MRNLEMRKIINKADNSYLDQIAKDFDLWIPGKKEVSPRYYFSAGSTLLDLAIGEGGGVPSGIMVEVSGWESTGKTAIGAAIGGSCQRLGGVVVLYDIEATFDYRQNSLYGLDARRILTPSSSPGTIEETFDQIKNLLNKTNEKCYCFIIDSLAALETLEEAGSSFSTPTMGTQRARKFSQVLRSMANLIQKKQATLVFINQLRKNIGQQWGRNESSPGGRAIRFYCSLRILLRQEGKIKENKNIIGIDIETEIIKNKVGIPYRKANFPLYFNYGIDDLESCVIFIRGNSDRLGKKGEKFRFDCIEEKSLIKFLNRLEREDKIGNLRKMVKEIWDEVYSDNRGRENKRV